MTAGAASYIAEKDTTLKSLRHIPGEDGWPLVGRMPEMVRDFNGMIHRSYEQYGEVSRSGSGLMSSGLLVMGPDNCKRIFLDTERNFSAQMGYAKSIGVFYGGGLLMRDFEDHRFQRRAFQSAFKNDAMKGYAELMNPIMERGLEGWGSTPNFLFFPQIKTMLLSVAAKVFFGVDDLGNAAQKLNQAFLDVAEKGIMSIIKLKIPGLAYYKGWQAKDYMDEFIGKLIPARRAGEGKDFMSYVCKVTKEDGSFFSDRELMQHLSFLMFAAHDTTTSALSHLVMLLGQHPDIQENLRQECRSLNKEYLDYDDLEKLPNLENAFFESLRLYPSVSMTTRRTIRECEIGGYRVPGNTVMMIPPQFNHTMAEWWDEPKKFDPDRFGPARQEQKRHAFSFMPFGGGAHKCIGMHFAIMNAKCFMHQFLQHYKFSTPANYNPHMQAVPMPRPSDFLPLTLEKIR